MLIMKNRILNVTGCALLYGNTLLSYIACLFPLSICVPCVVNCLSIPYVEENMTILLLTNIGCHHDNHTRLAAV